MNIEKKERKLSLFTDHLIIYIENLKESTGKLLKFATEFSKGTSIKSLYKN